MGRAPCCEKIGLKRGPWTPEEDKKLVDYINENGHGSWRALPKKAGLLRCGKSCRLRWTNYLRPDIKRGEFSLSEEQTIIQLHALLGNRWSAIASHLPKRTDNEIKNYWNTHLKKKLVKMGLDPATHKPTSDNSLMNSNVEPKTCVEAGVPAGLLWKAPVAPASNGSSATSHMAQWESARLEAEARLAQESQLRFKGLWRSGLSASNTINAAPLTTLPPLLSSLTPWNAPPFGGINTNSNAACADALKALNAVELMHVLNNWEKSLPGQARLMWPEAWRLPGMHFSLREAQAESSSCSSHCSDANTNNNAAVPALGTGGSRRHDHLSPTSTLCSLDSHCMKQKGLQSPLVSSAHSGAHVRKLSWSDGLAFLPPKPEVHVSLPISKVSSGFGLQAVGCKLEEESSTFSSLMHDAVFCTDATANAYMSCLEEPADVSPNLLKEQVVGEEALGGMSGACGGVSSGGVNDSLYTKLFVTCPDNAGDDRKGENLDPVQDEEVKGMAIEKDENCAMSHDEDGSNGKKELCSDASAHDACTGMQDGASNGATVSVNEGGPQGDPMEGEPDQTFTNSRDINSKNDDGMCRTMNLEGGVKDGVADRNSNTSRDDNKGSDGSDEGKSVRGSGEMVVAEVFKDLPKLKSKVSTRHVTSYCGLLSEDIPDYWSSIMLKEPTLHQVDMTF